MTNPWDELSKQENQEQRTAFLPPGRYVGLTIRKIKYLPNARNGAVVVVDVVTQGGEWYSIVRKLSGNSMQRSLQDINALMSAVGVTGSNEERKQTWQDALDPGDKLNGRTFDADAEEVRFRSKITGQDGVFTRITFKPSALLDLISEAPAYVPPVFDIATTGYVEHPDSPGWYYDPHNPGLGCLTIEQVLERSGK